MSSRPLLRRAALVLGCPFVLFSGLAAQGEGSPDVQRRTTRATRTDVAPTIDGRLDEALWQNAPTIGELTQVEPIEGGEPSQPTDIRILFDDDQLYLGMRFHDSHPELIRSTTRERDGQLQESDYVELVFDTFHDRRNAFFFQINPTGSKGDAVISNNGADFNKPWDGIWDAATRVDEGGWTAEFAIPFKTLNFDPTLTTWGFNIQRFIGRTREVLRWASPRRDYFLFDMFRAGELHGLEGIRQGIGLDVTPFLVTDWRNDRVLMQDDSDADVGLDAFYKLTPNLNLSLTFNTDFAEAEVDARQVNLTRFPLFFPERRDFFLQDSGLFAVDGAGRDALPFFSRRIGRSANGEEIPIVVGAKLTGRAGPYSIAFLDVQTDDFDPTGGGTPVDGQNMAVARVSRNVGERSRIGVFGSVGDPNGIDEGGVYGADSRFTTSTSTPGQTVSAGAWILYDDSRDVSGDDEAFGVWLDSNSDRWDYYVTARSIGDDYSPPLGFVPRRGIREYGAGTTFEPRIDEHIRNLEFSLDAQVITDQDDNVETVFAELQPFGIYWESGSALRTEVEFIHEDLAQGFTSGSVPVPAGEYDFARYRLELASPQKKELFAELTLTTGDFFDGTRDDVSVSFTWNPNALFNGSFEYARNDIDLAAGDFTSRIIRARTNFSFTPNLSWNSFVQWDNVSDTVGVNSRMRWIPSPGRDVFLVFNQTLFDDSDGSLYPLNQGVSFKVGYTLRF